jgi:monoamine oxidase
MSHSRREFIKYVVVGSVAAGCPINSTLLAAPDEAPAAPRLDGEHFEICHQVRDGHTFDRPAPTKEVGIAIIGGGVAGLSAAYFLGGDKDWLLLEKEDHFGGNAYQEDYAGQPFCTGSAYAYKHDDGDHLAAEIGLRLLPVNNPDPTILHKTFIPDTWKAGLDHLPYPKNVIASFKKFRDDVMKIDLKSRQDELDALHFTDFTAAYAPEITHWWDSYGPSNWGATTTDTSSLVAMDGLQGLINGDDDHRVILPGGLGCITHRLVEILLPKYKDRMLGEATVVAIVPEADSVHVTYFHAGQLTTVNAKAVIMGVPKYISSRLITEIPAEQKAAMRRTRYAPYPVVNVIFDKPVYNRGYDTWCPGNTFTDFIVADWTVRDQPGYQQKNNILSFYTPLREYQRATLLQEEGCKSLAAHVLADFQKALPEFNVNPVEVRIYRRGHPMFMATPGQFTKNRLVAAQPMDRIYFGNADSSGPESLTSESVRLSRVAAEWCDLVLSGKPGGKDLAQKALLAAHI